VIVESIVEGGPAEEAGLEPQDVITEVDQKATPSLRAFNAIFKEPRIYLISFQHQGEGVSITSLDLTKKVTKNED
jgi:S1-C subfamily serine protease